MLGEQCALMSQPSTLLVIFFLISKKIILKKHENKDNTKDTERGTERKKKRKEKDKNTRETTKTNYKEEN